MTTIHSLSPAFLKLYATYQKTQKIDLEEAFKQLSLEMGGDGESITKDQLDEYIKKAENGKNDVGESKLSALKLLQTNWDEISKGEDSITFSEMSAYSSILVMITAGGASDALKTIAETTETNEKDNFNLYSYILDATGASTTSGVTQSELSAYLSSLLSDTSGDSDNSNEIALLTNLIADFENLSAGKNAITQRTLEASKGHEA